MFAEGFTRKDLLEAVMGKSRVLEVYEIASRCLVGRYFQLSEKVRIREKLKEKGSKSKFLALKLGFAPAVAKTTLSRKVRKSLCKRLIVYTRWLSPKNSTKAKWLDPYHKFSPIYIC